MREKYIFCLEFILPVWGKYSETTFPFLNKEKVIYDLDEHLILMYHILLSLNAVKENTILTEL